MIARVGGTRTRQRGCARSVTVDCLGDAAWNPGVDAADISNAMDEVSAYADGPTGPGLADDDEEEDRGLAGSPYALTEDEFAQLTRQFGAMCRWESVNIENKLPVRDIQKDAEQQLLMALWSCGTRYKLQRFVVSAIKYFRDHPEAIPPQYSWRIGFASWAWLGRERLGPKHGFHVSVHDQWLAEALDLVAAPYDVMHGSMRQVVDYFQRCVDNGMTQERLSRSERDDVMEFLACAYSDDDGAGQLRVRLVDLAPKMATLPPKPSRYCPLVIDSFFPPYCKRFLMNCGNKIKDQVMKRDKVFHAPLSTDDLAHVLPDTHAGASNLAARDQVAKLARRAEECGDDLTRRLMTTIMGMETSVVRNGSLVKRELSRRLGVSSDEVERHIVKLRGWVEDLGGVSPLNTHATRFQLSEFPTAGDGTPML